jgi:hypothetical protein
MWLTQSTCTNEFVCCRLPFLIVRLFSCTSTYLTICILFFLLHLHFDILSNRKYLMSLICVLYICIFLLSTMCVYVFVLFVRHDACIKKIIVLFFDFSITILRIKKTKTKVNSDLKKERLLS